MEAQHHNSLGLNNLLLMLWCRTPQDTLKRHQFLNGSEMATLEGPKQYKADGFNVMANQCLKHNINNVSTKRNVL